ncbi:DUF4199 domain-containing protein [Mucilaginibacter segetis]|uniref:DUF4199 domain-containing protein n=1 Tax=Mucilaginibacter segetis TaxID=2793071 RepID=A0A934PSJ2_9SPHI|nr:DUF4199 domain-containing protein [Mucilaginibacter segetis]MBK0378630.1 DUF4199 domain-containing protein [Mucilaginibacter segetis]
MKKNIWVCGLIGGVIAASWGVLGEGVFSNLSLNTSMALGYAAMVLAFSLIFVAVKNYRDDYHGGSISFGRALTIGLLITLIASTVYVIIWMIDYSYFMPGFAEKYQARAMAELKASGASAAEIKKQGDEMAAMMETYNVSPLYRVMFTYLEIVPVGVVMSLLAALVLKRKDRSTVTV